MSLKNHLVVQARSGSLRGAVLGVAALGSKGHQSSYKRSTFWLDTFGATVGGGGVVKIKPIS